MGLALQVGMLADLRVNDLDGYELLKSEYDSINFCLNKAGLPEINENENLDEGEIFSCDMYGYIGLHHLRRYAAHVALNNNEPKPVPYGQSDDPIMYEYHRLTLRGWLGCIAKLFSTKLFKKIKYQHLILHSDCEGYYLPVEFENVLYLPKKLEITGGKVGSVQKLYAECLELAQLLEIPLEKDHEDDEFFEAVEAHPGEGVKWQEYAIESFSCIRLIRACEAALENQCAIVFC